MSRKSGRIAEIVEGFQGRALDARYLGYFDCFNRGLYYEAHDVLEDLWLADREGPDGAFYKGLIQLAGAFLHVQKNRLQPAKALLDLARANLGKYPGIHHQLGTSEVLSLIDRWQGILRDAGSGGPRLEDDSQPAIGLHQEVPGSGNG